MARGWRWSYPTVVESAPFALAPDISFSGRGRTGRWRREMHALMGGGLSNIAPHTI